MWNPQRISDIWQNFARSRSKNFVTHTWEVYFNRHYLPIDVELIHVFRFESRDKNSYGFWYLPRACKPKYLNDFLKSRHFNKFNMQILTFMQKQFLRNEILILIHIIWQSSPWFEIFFWSSALLNTRKKAAWRPLFPRPCGQLFGLRPTSFLFNLRHGRLGGCALTTTKVFLSVIKVIETLENRNCSWEQY